MSRFWAISGLALRELWMSFRLLALVAVVTAASLPALLLPPAVVPDLAGAPPDRLTWFATLLAVALAVGGGVAGFSVGAERRRGSAGWLVSRALPRPTLLLAWFASVALVVAAGMVPAGVLAWVALDGPALVPGGPVAFGLVLASVFVTAALAVALGCLVGALLPPLPAALVAILLAGIPMAVAAIQHLALPAMPGSPLGVLATLDEAARPVSAALQAGGVALGLTAALLVLAALAFERADL
ncbi:MAG TPA: hypothetical protein VF013_05670 [Candidatus Limnocylindria bacterium]